MKKYKHFSNLSFFPWQYQIVEYLIYILLFLIPLYINGNYLFPTNTPKIIATTLFIILILVFYLWGGLSQNKSFNITITGIVLSVFMLFLGISSLKGVDPINSFFGWRNVTPLITIYFLFIFSLILSRLIIIRKEIVPKVLLSSFVSSIMVMIIFYTGLKGVILTDGSTLGNSSYLGAYLFFNFFFGIILLLYYKKIWQRILVAFGSLFLVINPIFINKDVLLFKLNILDVFNNPLRLLGIANGATLGVLVTIFFAVTFFLTISKNKILKIIGITLFVFLAFSTLFIGRQLSTEGTSLNKVFTETKTNNRFLAWNIAQKEFNNNIVFGNGYNNYIYSFDKNKDSKMYENGYSVERFFKPHNVFWEFASETGILGLASYLLLLITVFISFLIKKVQDNHSDFFNKLRIILASLLIGYFIQNLFVFDTITSYTLLFLIISISMGLSKSYEIKIDTKFNTIKNSIIVFLMLICLLSLYYCVISPSIEAKSIPITNETRKISAFSGIMDDTFWVSNRLDFYQKNLNKINEENKNFYLKDLESMISIIEKDIEKQPNYSESYLIISQVACFYMMVEMKEGNVVKFNGINYNEDMWNKAYSNVLKSLELSKNNPKSYLVLSQLYLLKADLETSKSYIKKSLQLAPSYRDAYKIADNLLKISPDRDFEKYIETVKVKP